jgi:carboxyl-terminal processing protease
MGSRAKKTTLTGWFETLIRGFVLFCVLAGVAGIAWAQPAVTEQVSSDQADVFAQACQLVYEGKFELAGELVKGESCGVSTEFAEIAGIAEQYQALNQRRKEAHQKSYQERWDKLEKLYLAPDSNDVNDANDSGTSAVLSTAAILMELADEQQKGQILSHPAVKKAFEEAKAEAATYEAEGKWLDAYTSCYYWLQLVDRDNQQYEDHADDLVEKANIVAAFQDSPCESRVERYERIDKDMFIKAIDVVHSQYVDPQFLDYSEMALKAIKQSRMLAEVVRASFDQIQESQNGQAVPAIGQILYRPSSDSVAAWTSALQAVQDDIEQAPASISKDKFIDVFEKVSLINTTTVALPEGILIANFASASLSVLDPHTVLVWPKQVDDFRKSLTGEFAGIGVLISKEKGFLTAASLLPDTPAYRSGLDAGDIIEAVDDAPTKDMSLGCAVKRITGPAGTSVKLTVRTPSEEQTRDIIITRAKITVRTIRGWQRTQTGGWLYMIDDDRKIGYIRITSFSDKTADDFEKVLKLLEKQGLRGLVLDLRFNQGGLLESAVEIADNFIREGLIVRTQPKWGIATYLQARASGTHPDYPLVLLVDSLSASASEIVAGALQDPKYKRAIVVGERTHGKGSVQAITYRPGGGAQLKYTMAYYHLPSGQRVESRENMEKLGRKDWGIGPDIEIELTGDELTEMTKVQRDNDVLVKADHDLEAAPLKRHTIEETLASDPQLTVALLVVRTKLLEQGRMVATAK